MYEEYTSRNLSVFLLNNSCQLPANTAALSEWAERPCSSIYSCRHFHSNTYSWHTINREAVLVTIDSFLYEREIRIVTACCIFCDHMHASYRASCSLLLNLMIIIANQLNLHMTHVRVGLPYPSQHVTYW
jgi:hypothetical protein